MAAPIIVGEKVKARLSDYYRGNSSKGIAAKLTTVQLRIARSVINQLTRDCSYGCCASGMVRGRGVRTIGRHDGSRGPARIQVGDTQHEVFPVRHGNIATVGEIVCEAVAKGCFLPVGQTQDEPEPERKPEPKPQPKPERDVFQRFADKLRELREYLSGQPSNSDTIGNRPFEDGCRMIAVGLPIEAALDAATMDWAEDARRSNGIETYDQESFGEPIEGYHRAMPYVLRLIKARVPVYLVGPAGTGKSRLASDLADVLGLPFEQVPCAEGISVAWFSGRNMPSGFIETGWIRRYRDGGVFLLDEIDAADSNTATLLNGALAGSRFDNPVADGERGIIERHERFIPIAAANTMGTGADANYTARNRLDAATLDRFRMGRVRIGYDRRVEDILTDRGRQYADDVQPLILANGSQV